MNSFLALTDQMISHLGFQFGDYWNSEARQMIKQARRHPDATPFSSEVFLCDVFGGGHARPDRHVMDNVPHWRRSLRKLAGWGRLGDRLAGPGELLHQSLVYARISYDTAVWAGWELMRDDIEKYDITSPSEVWGEQAIDVHGRPLSLLTLKKLSAAIRLRDLVGSVDVLVEIGSGSGEQARMLHDLGVARRVVLVDIPPGLACAQINVASSGDVDGFDPARTTVGSAEFTILTPDQIGLVTGADFGLNIASFQEMTRPIVADYARWAQRSTAGFLCINLEADPPINGDQHINHEFYVEQFAPWQVRERRPWASRSISPAWESWPTQYELLHFAP